MGRFATAHLTPILLVAALSGCAQLEHRLGSPITMDAAGKIPVGSHYSTVLDELGPPTKISAVQNGMAFLYERVTLTENQYGLILPGDIGKWIKAVYASADADVEIILFVFDEFGNLRSADEQAWSADAGAGMSATLIFSAGSFTDTEQYESSAVRSLDWGRALTMSPMVLLNSRQSLENGENGLQLTTVPKGVGQHTLELKAD